MAIGIRMKIAGVDQATFERVEKQIDPQGNPPDGLIFHASGPIEGGWGVIDFWQTREQFDRFVQERIGPTMAGAGIDAHPDIKEFEVHEYFPR
ncbi:MAG TPA: hypothetical protein VHX66_00135 [Solirubrobacteraceae bacterium]|jgi:hypothetical protein|nr:hypothetical protein [Solirubrobacteraceae bacterium]